MCDIQPRGRRERRGVEINAKAKKYGSQMVTVETNVHTEFPTTVPYWSPLDYFLVQGVPAFQSLLSAHVCDLVIQKSLSKIKSDCQSQCSQSPIWGVVAVWSREVQGQNTATLSGLIFEHVFGIESQSETEKL